MNAGLVAAVVLAACEGAAKPSGPGPSAPGPSVPGPAAPGAAPIHDAARDAGELTAPIAAAATLRLAARCDAGAAEPSVLDVALAVRLDGAPVFRLDDEVYGSPGMAKLISDVEASDQRGALPLVRRAGSALELAAARPAVGVVTLRYRARSIAVTDRGARFGLRHDATGIGGLGAFFLVLPASRRVERIAVEWAPAVGCTEPMQGLSSFAETTGELQRLRMASYFFGRPQTFSTDDGSLHVRSAWFGAPALDTAAAAAWAARAFAAERVFFGDDDPSPYHLFARVLPAMTDRANGMGQPSSFLTAIGPATAFGPRLRTNIAHEMLHRWLGLRLRLGGPEGSSFWFTEGFTVHYANLLLLRAGLVAPDEFLAELNGTVTRQFANPRAAATNDEIRRGFFDDDALSVVPYTRGALYAAELDAAIRRASRGARSLDALVRELYTAALSAPAGDAGLRELPASAFRQAVVRELGQPGAERFDAVIARGEAPAPPPEAFGPCFERVPRTIAQFQLGFDERRSLAEPKAIRGLVAGSAAARAGLREGEALVAIESSFLFSDKEAVVTVVRREHPVAVRYLPAGPERDGFAWVRVNGVPDDRCRQPAGSRIRAQRRSSPDRGAHRRAGPDPDPPLGTADRATWPRWHQRDRRRGTRDPR